MDPDEGWQHPEAVVPRLWCSQRGAPDSERQWAIKVGLKLRKMFNAIERMWKRELWRHWRIQVFRAVLCDQGHAGPLRDHGGAFLRKKKLLDYYLDRK